MYLSQIRPNVRYSRIQNDFPIKNTFTAADHRMFYCIKGAGGIILNQKIYELKKNSLIYWRSGIPYSFMPNSEHPMSIIGVNFDFFDHDIFQSKHIYPFKAYEFSGKVIEKIDFEDTNLFNDVLYIDDFQDIMDTFIKINDQFTSQKKYHETICGNLLSEIILRIVQKNEETINLKKIRKVQPILNYIHENYNKKITNEQLANIFGYHPNHLNKLMLENVGTTLHKYLINYRITKAISLLQTTDMSVTEISNKLGFYDIKHFSKCFKQCTGSSPSVYRLI